MSRLLLGLKATKVLHDDLQIRRPVSATHLRKLGSDKLKSNCLSSNGEFQTFYTMDLSSASLGLLTPRIFLYISPRSRLAYNRKHKYNRN